MSSYLLVGAIIVSAIGSLVFSTLTYSLRELSRVRLSDFLERTGMAGWIQPTMERQQDLVFVTAVFRLLFNTGIVIASLLLCEKIFRTATGMYFGAAALATGVTLISSVMVATALARYAGDALVGSFVRPLHLLWLVMLPVTKLMHFVDSIVHRTVGRNGEDQPEQIEQEIEQEILDAVVEGQREGVVDEQERKMIESVIRFSDTTAGQVMTARPEIFGIEQTATLGEIKQALEASGHSRLPVYEKTLDHIVGVLYARDLLEYVGVAASQFNIRSAMRPALFVPKTKPVHDLMNDFKLQKIHIAIVLDEYGGTAGLVTIEDIIEELVGDISDEHEPVEPAMFKWAAEHIAEVDARIYIDELNRLAGLDLPEDAGYDTLGGFVSTHLGRIPPTGTNFEHDGVRFTVLDAEPQKVNRVKIELVHQPAEPMPAEAAAQARA